MTCGGGTQYAERTCSNPAPAQGGDDCVGNPRVNRECNPQQCPEVIREYSKSFIDV